MLSTAGSNSGSNGRVSLNVLGQRVSFSKKLLLYASFFIVLTLIFYFILTRINPVIGQKNIPPVSYIRPFSFTNQDGQPVTEKDVAGKVYVAEYFFTTCKGICPRMNNNLKNVYEALIEEKDFLILSHTCDPDTDSVQLLKKYADSMQVDTRRWFFLTGRKDSLYNMARISYTIDDPNDNLVNMEDDFMHSQLWALIDKNGNVRKIYDGLKDAEVRSLIKEAKRLLDKNNN